MTRTILHADLDAFYASVEILDDPSLRGKPVIVGGEPGARGVVSAASYEARRYGVHSAMPLRTAASLCPTGVFLAGRPDRYRELSTQVMRIFASFTPLVEPISLDEAFLDVTASREAFGDGVMIARQIKESVLHEVGLVVSVGVATNKLCAKVASDLRKPDALVDVRPGEEAAFLAPLPVSRLWGVGPQSRQALADYGVTTIGDRDVDDPARLEATLLDLAESVASRLRNHHMAAGAVQLKLRYEGFETLTRQMPVPRQTRESEPIYAAGVALLRKTLVRDRAVRLIGLTAINLTDVQQLTLFDAPDKTDRITRSIDAVRERFGEKAITRARLIGHRDQRRFDFGEKPEIPSDRDA